MQIFANGIFIIPLVFLLIQRIEDGKHCRNADRLIITNNCFEQSVLYDEFLNYCEALEGLPQDGINFPNRGLATAKAMA